MEAVKVLSFVLAIVVAIVVTAWLDNYIWFLLALLGGVAAGFVAYGALVKWLGKTQ